MLNRLTFTLDYARLGLLLLVAGTLLNGFYSALVSLYYPQIDNSTELAQQKYLGYAGDLHGDLIAVAIALPPFAPIDPTTSLWPYPYRKFVLQNHYHSFDLSGPAPVDTTTWSLPLSPHYGEDWEWFTPFYPGAPKGLENVITFHITPTSLLLYMMVKRIILAHGPVFVVTLYYALSLSTLAFACLALLPDWPRRLWAFAGIGLSYPFLQVLLRANLGSLITGFGLIFFIYLLCRTERHLLAAVFLAVACNTRPNAAVLLPLLLCFGWRRFAWATVVFFLVGGALTLLAYKVDQAWYPGYNLGYYAEAVRFYYKDYVMGKADSPGNNSLFGLIKLIGAAGGYPAGHHHRAFSLINAAVTASLAALEVGVCVLYLRRLLSRLEFAFLLVAIYMLVTSVFATYHLIVFAAFPLLLASPDVREITRRELVLLFASIFVLMPKLYWFQGIYTPDSFLNPLVMLAAVAWLIVLAARSPKGSPPSPDGPGEKAGPACGFALAKPPLP